MHKRIAIISTHPIQYYAPVFNLLAQKMQVKVFYTAGDQFLSKYDRGFKKQIEWDIPLLSGYEYQFLENIAKDKGSHHFKGITNPDAIKQIKSYQPDGILVYGWAYTSHLRILRYFKGKIPIYFRGDSTLLNQKTGAKNILRGLFLRWVYKHIDMAFYVGSANKAYFKKYGLREDQLIFAPHAIDNYRFAEERITEANLIREKLNISMNHILVLFAGKLDPVKNPFLLLNAFKKIQKKEVHLLFVGNGVLEEGLKSMVKHENIKNVHFLDFQNQTMMPIIYQSCDLFCLPSTSETWGLAVNEAMAASKAILVSNKVGSSQDLATKETGTIFKSEDLIDLRQKLIALTKDKSELKSMGQNAFNFIQNWSFENQVDAISKYANNR